MKFTKQVLGEIPRCYCTSSVNIDDELYILLASEAEGGPCYAYHGENYEIRETVWESAGGTMSIVQIPGTNGEFLAVQNFFPGFNSATAKIVWGRRDKAKGWQIKDVLNLPYVHRFDILSGGGKLYFLGATLCTSKKEREDWSDPGKIWVGELPKDLNQPLTVEPVMENLTHNHGYWHGSWKGMEAGFVTADEGVFVAIPPQQPGGAWTFEHIIKKPVSDIAVVDLNGDGIDELITIEPFHGRNIYIYEKKNGQDYEIAYEYPGEIEFAHALWGGKIKGKPVLFGGVRRKNAELFKIEYQSDKGSYDAVIIEEGSGPANIAIANDHGKDIIICANNTIHQGAIQIIE